MIFQNANQKRPGLDLENFPLAYLPGKKVLSFFPFWPFINATCVLFRKFSKVWDVDESANIKERKFQSRFGIFLIWTKSTWKKMEQQCFKALWAWARNLKLNYFWETCNFKSTYLRKFMATKMLCRSVSLKKDLLKIWF